MNILYIFICPIIPYQGGVQRVTETLSREFLKRGHNVTFLTYDFKELVDSPDIICSQQYVELKNRGDDEVKKDLERIVSEFGITHVINQSCTEQTNRIVRLLPDSLESKVIYCYHVIPFCYMNYTRWQIKGAPAANYRQKLFKTVSMMFPRIYKSFFSHVEKKGLHPGFRLASKFCFISDKYFKNILDNMPDAPRDKMVAINNPNSYSIQNHLLEYDNRENAVVWVGRLENSQKNIFGFLKMWKIFSDSNPGWKAYVVGEGRDLENARTYIANNRLSNVTLEGCQPDVMSYYKKCKFLVVTSFWESWGVIITEAMTCGCIPAVMNTFPTLPDIVDDKQNGLICPTDEKEMATILSETIKDTVLCNMLAANAVEKVKKFDVSNIASQWEALLESL